MGSVAINAEPLTHANPTGGESQGFRLHQGNIGLDERHYVTLSEWITLQSATVAANVTLFESTIQAAFTPTGGWSQDRLDALYRACVRMWTPAVTLP